MSRLLAWIRRPGPLRRWLAGGQISTAEAEQAAGYLGACRRRGVAP